MKLLYYISILLLFSSQSFAQQLSPGYKTKNKIYIEGFLNEINGNVYLVKTEYSNKNTYFVILSAYDTVHLKKQFEKKISISTKKGYVVKPMEILTLNNKIYFFYTELNTFTGHNILYVNNINYNGDNAWTKAIDTVKSTFSSDKNLKIVVDEISNNLIIIKKYTDAIEAPNILNIKSYNSEMIPKWETNVDIPKMQTNLDFKDIIFDGANRVYLHSEIVYLPNNKKDSQKIMKGKRHHIWCYDYSEDRLKEFEVELHEKSITDMMMKLDKTNLKIYGAFADDGDFTVKGLFSLVIDNDFNVLSSSLDPLTEKFFNLYPAEKEMNKDISNLYMRNLITLENGNNLLLFESIYKTVSDFLDPRTNMYNYVETYHYNNIITFEYDTSRTLTSVTLIPKFQSSTIDQGYYSSYKTYLKGNDLYIFFNDNKSNYEVDFHQYDEYRPLVNYRNLAITAVKYSNGELTKVFSKTKFNFYVPKVISGEVFNNKIYFHSEKGKKYQLIQINLDD